MERQTRLIHRHWWLVGTVVLVAVAAGLFPRLAETSSEGTIDQPPLITIIFDTSSSMQWTDQPGAYPELDEGDVAGDDLETWEPGSALNLPGSERVGEGPDPSDGDTVEAVGPCKVWHAQEGDEEQCDDYYRPSNCGDDCDYFSDMEARLTAMQNDEDTYRLTAEDNTPGHIQIKQILTGDMRLNDEPGPGCWFVPRARGAMHEEQICCRERGESGQCLRDGDEDYNDNQDPNPEPFEQLVDYDEPIPHYQEVYDDQDMGLMDGLGDTAIFSVAMFDGYRRDGTRDDGWSFPIRDIMVADDSPYSDLGWTGSDHNCDEEGEDADDECYDMGINRFVGPTEFSNIEDGDLLRYSQYAQQAILDSGFLIDEEPGQTDPLSTDVSEGSLDEDQVFTYPLGKQPIAQASPFGAVFHDLHQFYREGQYDGITEDEPDNPPSYNYNEDGNDPYQRCRARHSVLMTDGMVEPEAPGGAGDELGSEVLQGGGFGYDPKNYPYKTAEDAIDDLIEDEIENVGYVDERYEPRVHVVGVGVVGERGSELHNRALDKMAQMAREGGTCAEAYIDPDHIVDDEDTDADECGEDWCLEHQAELLGDGEGFDGYTYEDPTGESNLDGDDCRHPALVLTDESRDSLEEAFALVFNRVAGMSGVEARTRPAITNDLDWDERLGQYRFFSGFEQGTNPNWRGLMQRRLLECDPDDGTLEDDPVHDPIHEHVNRLMLELSEAEALDEETTASEELDEEGYETDRRRVFTAAPTFLDSENGDVTADSMGDRADEEDLFEISYDLFDESESDDDFGTLRLDGDEQLHTRVPFERDELELYLEENHEEEGEDWYSDYWNVDGDEDDFEEFIDAVRRRTPDRMDRVLGGIRSSDPVAVGAPTLDLPIDSYRRFRRDQDDRNTMLYTTGVDGQLRALYAGEPDVVPRERGGDDGEDSTEAANQREAWAYIPQMLHSHLHQATDRTMPAALMDGAPVVQDIRLCAGGSDFSTNKRVCPADLGAAEQWRTVLVQGMGMAGSGYFALDVTRTGDADEVPDPAVMWEFSPDWEFAQIQEFAGETWRYDNVGDPEDTECDGGLSWPDWLEWAFDFLDDITDTGLFNGDPEEERNELPFLGATVGEAELGMVDLEVDGETTQRPVAVFGGGSSANVHQSPLSGNEDCADEIAGRAIYVVDLQSGQLIRRFIGPDEFDGDALDEDDEIFPGEITGTPVLSGANPADLSTRGFIGDEDGRMYRIDLSDPDPEEWEVSLFYDPDEAGHINLSDFDEPGPAAYQPAVTVRGTNRDLVLSYGLADRGDTASGETRQAIITLQEQYTFDTDDEEFDVDAQPLWIEEFGGTNENERLTGPPLIFDNDVFFTTYFERGEDEHDLCETGGSRIWRLDYRGEEGCDPFDDNTDICPSEGAWPEDGKYVEQNTVIRGVDITMGPQCQRHGEDAFGATGGAEPQLVAQTAGGAAPADSDEDMETEGVGDEFEEVTLGLDPPETQAVPLNWSVIEQ